LKQGAQDQEQPYLNRLAREAAESQEVQPEKTTLLPEPTKPDESK
jgi:hypothetical protein